MIVFQIIGFIVAVVSLVLMIWLHRRTSGLQDIIAKSTKDALEFIVNLVINAAADPRTVRRLIDDYSKNNNEWRGGVSRGDDFKYHISWEIKSREPLRIGDIEIKVIECKS